MLTKKTTKKLIGIWLFSFLSQLAFLQIQFSSADTDSLILEEIKTALQTDYLTPEKLPGDFPNSLSEVNAYLEKTGDPYLQYYTPQEAKELLESLEGKLSGIWAVIVFNQHKIPEVKRILPNTPAAQAGLQIGDRIAKIDQLAFSDLKDLPHLLSSIRGEENTQVKLTIYRNGTIIEKTLTRKQIQIPLVQADKQGSVCMIRQLSFDIGSSEAFKKKIQEIWPCSAFIFDLRGNPGGVVEETLKLLDIFIAENRPLLRITTKTEVESYLAQKSDFSISSSPIFLLIDQDTASAAEIFAGTLKFYFPQSTYLIGEKSFGKGTMQQLKELSDRSILKLTIALRHIANQAESINQKGLEPDYRLVDDPATETDEVLAHLWIHNR